ncbi:MAG: threonine-phosphate decarboxylase [Tissierellaceae bacterium]
MEHGGDLISYEKCYRGELIDYSSNINPLGPPSGLKDILMSSFDSLQVYPDIKYRELKASLSNYLKCQVENTIVGNGAVELIDNFTALANRVLVYIPSFSEYEKRALIHGKEVIRIPYNSDYGIDTRDLKGIIEKGDMLILGNPNNPTGLRIDKTELLIIYNLIIKSEAYLLLDEAFFEFCPEDYDSIELFRQYNYEGLGIIRAATKFFALPGIRLGYGCTSRFLAREISEVQLPWSINSFAESAGKYIFNDEEYIRESKDYIDRERKYIFRELSKLSSFKAFYTEANYTLIKLLDLDEEYVFDFFLQRGIVIRKCSSFPGLDNTYIRVAIKSREDNKRLIEIFNELEIVV